MGTPPEGNCCLIADFPADLDLRYWRASGIVIPWHDAGRLAMVKIRQPAGARPIVMPKRIGTGPTTSIRAEDPEGDPARHASAAGDRRRGAFDALATRARVGRPGERHHDRIGIDPPRSLDAARVAPMPSMVRRTRCRPGWRWSRRRRGLPEEVFVRVRPPEPFKDWGEFHSSGFNRIRYLWGGILSRPGAPWDELSKERWGPGRTDPAPGIVLDRPVRPAIRPGPADEYDRQERAAILEFDGGFTREVAERAAGLV